MNADRTIRLLSRHERGRAPHLTPRTDRAQRPAGNANEGFTISPR